MKTRIIALIISLLSCNLIFAQTEFYEKYSGKEGVSRIYISETMFSLISANNVEVEQLDSAPIEISDIINDLRSLYILNCESDGPLKEMKADFNDMIKKQKAELLMEIEDDDELIKIYINRKDKLITNVYLNILSDSELMIIHFAGDLSEEQIKRMIG